MRQRENRRLVYSSETGSVRYCPRCGLPAHAGRCADAAPQTTPGFPRDGVVRIAMERAGRRGKAVTVIHGVLADEAALAELAKTLKQLTGTGGTVRGTAIELQGNQRERVAAYLTGAGYRVKLAGG